MNIPSSAVSGLLFSYLIRLADVKKPKNRFVDAKYLTVFAEA